jgi:hypothetical protein
MHVNCYLVATLLLLCVTVSRSFIITIDAHAEDCFFDRVSSGTKMSLMFEVAEGGFLDIDVKVIYNFLHFAAPVFSCIRYCILCFKLYFSLTGLSGIIFVIYLDYRSGWKEYLLRRTGIKWQVHICCSYGRRIPVLLQQQNVDDDTESRDVHHGCW